MSLISKTEQNYNERAQQLLSRYHLETGLHWKDTPMQACKWLSTLKPSITPSTWRQYKASLVYFMGHSGPAECVEYLSAQTTNGCLHRCHSERTSRKRSKHLSPQDLATIHDHLNYEFKYDWIIGAWLYFGILTGLRPVEWQDAELNVKDKRLLVKNAKFDDNRACGEYRTLILSGMTDNDLQVLDDFIAHVKKDSYDALYLGCRCRLNKLCRKIWPRRKLNITLYSGRHQFSADAKKTYGDRRIVAALMGHRSDLTATEHYARRRSGVNPLKVEASSENIELVKHRELKGFPGKKLEDSDLNNRKED